MFDGTWQVVYCEKDGQRIDTGASQNVTIRGETLTCSLDGKQKTLRLRFGPNMTVWATEIGAGATGSDASRPGQDADRPGQDPNRPRQDPNRPGQDPNRPKQDPNRPGTSGTAGDAHQGVYIASQEYLCFAFQKSGTQPGARPGTGPSTGQGGTRPGEQPGGQAGTNRPGSDESRPGASAGTGQFQKPAMVLILRKNPAGK
jgi:hypothetical protein